MKRTHALALLTVSSCLVVLILANRGYLQSPNSHTNAAIAISIRDDDQDYSDVIECLKSIEKHFTTAYPIILFVDRVDSKRLNELRRAAPGLNLSMNAVDFLTIPDWIDDSVIPESFGSNTKFDSMGYRGMCRFFSAPFASHPALAPFNYYMRLDSDSRLVRTPGDILKHANDNNLHYMYATLQHDAEWCTDGLFDAALEFSDIHNISRSRLDWLLDSSGKYNLLIYYTNIEVIDLDFVRSAKYQEWFAHVDRKLGIYTRRWGTIGTQLILYSIGDAPIRTLGLSLLTDRVEQMSGFVYYHQGYHVNVYDVVWVLGVCFAVCFALFCMFVRRRRHVRRR